VTGEEYLDVFEWMTMTSSDEFGVWRDDDDLTVTIMRINELTTDDGRRVHYLQFVFKTKRLHTDAIVFKGKRLQSGYKTAL
jgi:hypothetical protein